MNRARQRRHDEREIGRQILHAATVLPEGWQMRIEIEAGSGDVHLIDPEGEEHRFHPDETLAEAIGEAVTFSHQSETEE